MEKELLSKGAPVFYHNRYCDQENIEINMSGVRYKHKNSRGQNHHYVFNIKYPNFRSIKILVANLNHDDKVLTCCSNVWITRTQESKNVDASSGNYAVRNNIV